MNIKSSNHFCTHHLSVGFLVQLPTIICALSASCAPRTRVLGLESTDRALHSHSHFAFPQIGKKHHRSRFRRRTHRAARTAALRVVDRTDRYMTRPLSDLSWYLPRASSQRRGLPSSLCCSQNFISSTWAVSVPLALSLRVYADFQLRFGATKTSVDHHRPAGQ
jgi:hypothetical protein